MEFNARFGVSNPQLINGQSKIVCKPTNEKCEWKLTANKIAAWLLESSGAILKFVLRPVTFIYEIVTADPHRQDLKENIIENQIKAYYETVKQLKSENPSDYFNAKQLNQRLDGQLSESHINTFATELCSLLTQIESLKKRLDSEKTPFQEIWITPGQCTTVNRKTYMVTELESISNRLDKILETEYYKNTVNEKDNIGIKIVQSLNYARNNSKSDEAYMYYGRSQILCNESHTNEVISNTDLISDQLLKKCANILTKIYKNPFYANANSTISNISYRLSNLDRSARNFVGKFLPLNYDAHHKNPTVQITGIENPSNTDDKIQMNVGPTPTSSSYIDHLRYLRSQNKCEVRFSLQSTQQNSEESRSVRRLYEDTEEFRKDGTLHLISLPYNMESMTHPATLIEQIPIKGNFDGECLKLLKQNHLQTTNQTKSIHVDQELTDAETTNRFVIPENNLNDQDLDACYSATLQFFEQFPLKNDATQPDKIMRIQNMQLLVQTYIILKIVSKIPSEKTIDNISIACKQCIDRGVVLIMMVKLIDFIHSIEGKSGEELSLEISKFNELLIGLIIGRPQQVDKRIGMKRTTQAFINFLHFLGSFKSESLTLVVKKFYEGLPSEESLIYVY